MAVFAGGGALEAAEAVCDAAGDLSTDVLTGLTSLVDKSLLVQVEQPGGEPRFSMLETIREYGLEQLAASGEEAAIRRRHAAWCWDLAEHAWERFWRHAHDVRAVGQLAAELDNLRAALAWLIREGDAEAAMWLGGTRWPLWYFRGYFGEGRRWLEQALQLDSVRRTTPLASR